MAGTNEELSDECGVCGRPLGYREGLLMTVRDSSMTYPDQPSLDGRRLVLACGDEHLDELRERYRRRPFVEAELWAARIRLALSQRPTGLTEYELARLAGLSRQQVTQARAWQRAQTGPTEPGAAHRLDAATGRPRPCAE